MTRVRASPMLARWLAQLQGLDEPPPAARPPVDAEGEHRAEALGQVLPAALIVRMAASPA